MSLSCRVVRPRLSEWVEAEAAATPVLPADAAPSTDAAWREAMAAHLAICPGCTRDAALLRAARRELRALPHPPAPSHLRSTIRAQLERESAATVMAPPHRSGNGLSRFFLRPAGAAWATGAALAAFCLFIVARNPAPSVNEALSQNSTSTAPPAPATGDAASVRPAPNTSSQRKGKSLPGKAAPRPTVGKAAKRAVPKQATAASKPDEAGAVVKAPQAAPARRLSRPPLQPKIASAAPRSGAGRSAALRQPAADAVTPQRAPIQHAAPRPATPSASAKRADRADSTTTTQQRPVSRARQAASLNAARPLPLRVELQPLPGERDAATPPADEAAPAMTRRSTTASPGVERPAPQASRRPEAAAPPAGFAAPQRKTDDEATGAVNDAARSAAPVQEAPAEQARPAPAQRTARRLKIVPPVGVGEARLEVERVPAARAKGEAVKPLVLWRGRAEQGQGIAATLPSTTGTATWRVSLVDTATSRVVATALVVVDEAGG